MGLFSSSSDNDYAEMPLQRVSDVPIGVIPAFTVHNQPITLKLQEKRISFSGDDFYIKDAATDQPVLECKAKVMSLHGRKDFIDLRGQTLFTIKKQLLRIHATFDGVSPQDDSTVLFTIKKSFAIGKAKLNVTFRNAADGQETVLCLRGDFFDRKAVITLGSPEGPIVGKISRNFLNMREIFSDKQTYFLTIAPGVDISLLAALCVCLDETENENQH